ncbi:hypothetical protein AALB52_22590 [Lachnospiraceae bacterium 38-14]
MKRKILVGIICFTGLLTFVSYNFVYANSTGNKMNEYGKKFAFIYSASQKTMRAREKAVFENSDFSINKSEIRRQAQLVQINMEGSTKELAKEAIYELIERKTLYALAVEKGYLVSDEDFEEYKSKFCDSMQGAENEEDIKQFFAGFGGEEDYWSTMETTLRESLTIRKYLDDRMKRYAREKGQNISNIDFQQKWSKEEEKIKRDVLHKAEITDSDKEFLIDEAIDCLE